MKRILVLALAGLFPGLVSAAAQTNAAQDQKIRVQVVLDRFEADTKIGSQPFFFLLVPDEKGTLRVAAEPSNALPCPVDRSVQFVGTQVESTVHPKPDGSYGVQLTFTERALAGCRDVNGVSIPVFSNRIVAHTVTLRDAEAGEILLRGDSLKKEFTRVTVTVTPR
jgi:hypothetical protein